MHIVIVGVGKMGSILTKQLSEEGHDVTIVDINGDVTKRISTAYDVMGIEGNGTSYEVLKSANIENADLLIAVTHSDEVNLLCCVIAKKAKCKTIARVRNPVYSDECELFKKDMDISMIINPEYSAAKEISRLVRFPSALDIDSFVRGSIEMFHFRVRPNAPIIGKTLREIAGMFRGILVCMAQRGSEIYIPDGNFVPMEGDVLSVIVAPESAQHFFDSVGTKFDKIKSAMIIGGGELAFYVADMFLKSGIKLTLIEKNIKRCEELSESLGGANIVCGDGTDQDLLSEEHLDRMDVLLASTGMDEENIILSLYAKDKVKSKIITKISHLNFNSLISSLDLDSLINPKEITAEHILQYVRAMSNSMGSNVETLYRLKDGRAEALEFIVKKDFPHVDIQIQHMNLKSELLIAGIARDGRLIVPGGSDVFKPGDSVIVVTTKKGFNDISEIFERQGADR